MPNLSNPFGKIVSFKRKCIWEVMVQEIIKVTKN